MSKRVKALSLALIFGEAGARFDAEFLRGNYAGAAEIARRMAALSTPGRDAHGHGRAREQDR